MPLHLLPKKSWHVYNAENIARVKRDEAAAQAHEEALEQAQQEVDSARRLALLRGEDIPQHLQQSALESEGNSRKHSDLQSNDVEESEALSARPRKRRRRHGEDDTQAEMRFAREDLAAGEAARATFQIRPDNTRVDDDNGPLVDDAGHLQLFSAPEEDNRTKKQSKRDHSQKRKAKTKGTEHEDEGMRFRDAAGRGASGDPWYTIAKATDPSSREQDKDNGVVLAAVPEKDVWGNEDPRRRQRESQRLATGDPFAAMQSAQRQLKQSTHDRGKWQRERRAKLDAEEEERRRRHRHSDLWQRYESGRKGELRVGEMDDDDLEGFRLGDSPKKERSRDNHHRSHNHRRHHRHTRSRRRSRSRSHEREKHRERHQLSAG